MTKETYLELREKTLDYFSRAHIALTSAEEDAIEVADFGLNDVMRTGLESIVYINTDRCCAKEMVLLPHQTCPEHLHPPVGEDYPGKEETFRCRMAPYTCMWRVRPPKTAALRRPPEMRLITPYSTK